MIRQKSITHKIFQLTNFYYLFLINVGFIGEFSVEYLTMIIVYETVLHFLILKTGNIQLNFYIL